MYEAEERPYIIHGGEVCPLDSSLCASLGVIGMIDASILAPPSHLGAHGLSSLVRPQSFDGTASLDLDKVGVDLESGESFTFALERIDGGVSRVVVMAAEVIGVPESGLTRGTKEVDRDLD
jgi:hypothetical protein